MVRAVSRKLIRDNGFTLTELLVVISLMGVVLGAAYAVLGVSYRAIDLQSRDTFRTEALSVPLQRMDVILSQNIAIESGSALQLTCLTDQDSDGDQEYHVFQVTADGRLIEDAYEVGDGGLVEPSSVRHFTWQDATAVSRNVNTATQPLFEYFYEAGEANPVPTQAISVQVNPLVTYDGENFSSSRRIMFRNRDAWRGI